MINKKGSARAAVIIIIAVIAVAAVALTLFGMYLHATEIRFDYTESDSMIVIDGITEEEMRQNGYGFRCPFFGNSETLFERGAGYSVHIGPVGKKTEENIPVYSAVNGVIGDYGHELQSLYKNDFKISYDVKNDGELLTVVFTGEAYPDGLDGEALPFEKTFMFSIKDAGTHNLPQLVFES